MIGLYLATSTGAVLDCIWPRQQELDAISLVTVTPCRRCDTAYRIVVRLVLRTTLWTPSFRIPSHFRVTGIAHFILAFHYKTVKIEPAYRTSRTTP
jgi:hypothetical protein